ncbi:MAG: hypothetical protein Q8N70_11255 [Deltaproteobacteria bacterium]|nr:hypothetical protein [Deltaproteobacteria bacterium]
MNDIEGLRSWFDMPVLSTPFILREPQDERCAEGLTTNELQNDY